MAKKTNTSRKTLTFDAAQHKYYFNGTELSSVTTFLSTFSNKFEALFPSINKAKSNKKKNMGITSPEKLRQYWRLHGERKRCIGTATHAFAEMYILDRETVPLTNYDKAVVKAIAKLEKNWDIIGAEQRVYSTESFLAGTYDLKIKHKKTGTLGLVDWKVTEDMDKSYGKLKGVFKDLKDSPLNKYFIQLNIYSLLDKDDIPEDKLFVIKLGSDGEFTAYSIKNAQRSVRKDVEKIITDRVLEHHPLLNL